MGLLPMDEARPHGAVSGGAGRSRAGNLGFLLLPLEAPG